MKRIRIPETDLWISSMGCGCVNAGLKWEGQSADEVAEISMIQPVYILTGCRQRSEEVKEY